MDTNYRKLTLRGKTLLCLPESQYSNQEITQMMDARVSDLIFDILMKDITNKDELCLKVAKSWLLTAIAAELLGRMANAHKLDAIKFVRHLLNCGMAAAKEITELCMGLEVHWTCVPEPTTVTLYIIEI